jgi:uncharacterized membrane protein
MIQFMKDAVGTVDGSENSMWHRLSAAVRDHKPEADASRAPKSGWSSVTINRRPEELLPDGRLPAPLANLGDDVEVRIRPAPGGKGAELSARLKSQQPSGASVLSRIAGHDPRQNLRSALRQAKQLIEVGEVLRVDPAPHGARGEGPGGKLVALATRRAGGEGNS